MACTAAFPYSAPLAEKAMLGVTPILTVLCLLLKPVVRHLKFVDHLYRLTACPHSLPLRLQFSIRPTSLVFPHLATRPLSIPNILVGVRSMQA